MSKESKFTEIDVLTALFFYSRSFHAYVLRISPDFFEEQNQDFFEILQKYYRAYNKVPDQKVYEVELDGNDQKNALAVWDKCYKNYAKIKNLTHEYILEKIDEFTKKGFLKKFLIDSYDQYEQGKYDHIIRNVSKLTESIISNDMGEEYHDEKFLDKRYDSDNFGSLIRTGYATFDQLFGGWYKKALHVIAGPANSGKTMWLVNFVSNLLLNQTQTNMKILYITLEIDEAQVGRRLDACLTETPMSEVIKFRDLKLREKIAESKETRGNCLIIKEMPGYKTTPSDIEAMMRNLEITSEGKMKPDIVFVDYLGLLSPSRLTKDMGLYEKGLLLSVEMRSLAQRYGIPVIVAAQTNRSSFEDRVGMDKISDSIGISQTCDMLMTINRNDELDSKNQVNIYMAKSRFCRNNEMFLFQVRYDCMRVDDIVTT